MSGTKILAVDDDPINIEMLQEILESYEVIVARSGEQAVEAARSHRPDLVLMDVNMPGMDGYEACRRIRQEPSTSDAKVILVSAKAMTSERVAGYEAGAHDYITKPFEEDELLAKVRVWTENSGSSGDVPQGVPHAS